MIFVICGNGKGKTTGAVGMGIRAVGSGKRVLMIQFLKPGDSSEVKTIKNIKNFDAQSFGTRDFVISKTKKDIQLAGKGFEKARTKGIKYDLLILDEINLAVHLGLIGEKLVLDFLKEYKNKLDIVLTGRYCKKSVKDIADLVSEIREIKHYGDSREGIEY